MKNMLTISLFILIIASSTGLQSSNMGIQTIKLRIANPYQYGILVAVIPQLTPNQLVAIYYVPAKGDNYFDGSLDMFVLPTDMVGLIGTQLTAKASDEEIEMARNSIVTAFAAGKLSIWRITRTIQGLTKVFLTLNDLGSGVLALIPNKPVQTDSPVEISFDLWTWPIAR